jgi:gliding motility-associated protein GldE
LEDPDSDPHLYSFKILLSVLSGNMSAGLVIGIVVVFLLLFFSAMISGSEIAFFSFSPANLKQIRENETGTNKIILSLLDIPKRLLATILISNNFVNVGIVILSSYLISEIFNFTDFPVLGFIIEVVVITTFILLFGEIIPKIFAAQKPVLFATVMAKPLRFLAKLFYPLGILLVKFTSVIDKRIERKGVDVSMSDLSDAIDITADENMDEEDTKILKGIVRFTDIDVKEIMKSRVDVTALDAETSFKEVLKTIIDSGYSRIPVFEETFDNVKGVLYIKDLLPHLDEKDDYNWPALLRKPFFVPENKKINDLLKEFQDKKIHLAIVVDEYGGTSGIVTLEDILEEIVGEITDEFDAPEDEVDYKKINDSTYLFEGKTSINDFCKIVGIDDDIFDEVKGESDSLAGLILELEGEIPEKGSNTSFKNFVFEVYTVDERRIKEIKVTINEIEEDEND